MGDANLDSLDTDMVDDHRNARRGFDQFFLNMRLSKYFKIDRFRFQIFAEAYNITNRTNFTSVFFRYDTPDFGKPLEAFDARRMQFGARIDF